MTRLFLLELLQRLLRQCSGYFAVWTSDSRRLARHAPTGDVGAARALITGELK